MIRMLSRVCADFYDKKHHLILKITPRQLGLYFDAPDAIQEDPLYQMLLDDGSILLSDNSKKQKALENDPYAGATAEGKEIKPKTAAKPKAAAKENTESKTEEKIDTMTGKKTVNENSDIKT